jgi:hypothetical protein
MLTVNPGPVGRRTAHVANVLRVESYGLQCDDGQLVGIVTRPDADVPAAGHPDAASLVLVFGDDAECGPFLLRPCPNRLDTLVDSLVTSPHAVQA